MLLILFLMSKVSYNSKNNIKLSCAINQSRKTGTIFECHINFVFSLMNVNVSFLHIIIFGERRKVFLNLLLATVVSFMFIV